MSGSRILQTSTSESSSRNKTDFSIDRSTVSKVITATRQKEERARNGDVIEPVVKVSKGGLARYPEIDAVVGNFIDTQATKGIIPPDQELRTLARDAAERLGIDFKASVKWLENVGL
jgi:hypothetical protein